MSRTNSTTVTVSAPPALRPSTLRAGLALAVIAAFAAFAMRAQAQAPSSSAFQLRPLVGALVATGDQRAVLENTVLVGGQGAYSLNESFGLVGSFGWSPNEDQTSAARNDLQFVAGLTFGF